MIQTSKYIHTIFRDFMECEITKMVVAIVTEINQ